MPPAPRRGIEVTALIHIDVAKPASTHCLPVNSGTGLPTASACPPGPGRPVVAVGGLRRIFGGDGIIAH